ncbi:MAG TPA: hypothetical protein O0X25_02360 [Methanocorpusculum sp.]|nr:hypothetical protein [Methanocorpusculum sp.]HJJ57483.1 hypothetical protein [Methanocorpusculum sp.]
MGRSFRWGFAAGRQEAAGYPDESALVFWPDVSCDSAVLSGYVIE